MCDVLGPPQRTCPFQRYHVYRSRNTILVFGIDKVKKEYSCLKIPKKEEVLELQEGEQRFPLDQLEPHLASLRRDGLEEVALRASGLVGFIRFTGGYYLILIKSHKKVGRIGHHFVLSIESTALVPLFNDASKEEKNFKDQFHKLNLSKDFYYSYSYELSRTMQQNLADAKSTGPKLRPLFLETDPNKHHRFVWNHYHMTPFFAKEGWQHWCLSIIHGFFGNTRCSSFGWSFSVALIARRSRFYAGTRYRKRGLNVHGQVGNDVETEQLLCDDSTRNFASGHVMSFVQIRGSVPLFWSQEAAAYNPKPPVVYPRCDPTLSATRKHFVDLLERYGTPQLVVNLMKAKKVDSYEVRLSKHFESAIERMNRELPPEVRIMYRPFDMKNHAKSNNSIFEVFSRLAESVVTRVGFFHTKLGLEGKPERLQNGVVRTNCVDCLDRTNVLQFFVGLEVMKQQLTAMSLLPEPKMDFESQAVLVLSELYDVMGDHVALQYAGSIAHKKYQLLGSRPRMMPTSKELLTSIHRHYHNSFTDSEKQASQNLFLGLYQPSKHPPMEKLDCDSWLHHQPLEDDYTPGGWWLEPLRRHQESMAPLLSDQEQYQVKLSPEDLRKWFQQVHKTQKYTHFEKLLANVDATFAFVQINPGHRPLRKLRAASRSGPPLTLKSTACPTPLAPEVLAVYKAYVGRIKLAKFDAVLPKFRSVFLEEAPKRVAPGDALKLYEDMKRLLRKLRKQRTDEKGSKSLKEKYEKLVRSLPLHSDMPRIQSAQAPLRHAQASGSAAPMTPQPAKTLSWEGDASLALCRYCHQVFALTPSTSAPALCPRHQRRERQLQKFVQGPEREEPSTKLPPPSAEKPWQGWTRAWGSAKEKEKCQGEEDTTNKAQAEDPKAARLELLRPYIFPHGPLPTPKTGQELGLPSWYLAPSSSPPSVRSHMAQPLQPRAKSGITKDKSKVRRNSNAGHTLGAHVRTPSANLASPKAEMVGRSIFGNVVQLIEDLK
ncbi:unnamed protein product [Effrenium voratum]|uniref:SAC domain-containing protein n=1 Tax=Effrenium voratum TaxID=2562239 RepID=A0AA36MWY4_9DINO|nr:unnamed protein product [Effrenium voratum]